MPILPKRKHRQERSQCVRQAAVPPQGLRCLQGAGADRPVRARAQGGNLAGVPGTLEPAGCFADFRGVAPHRGRLAKKNSGGCPPWLTASPKPGLTTSLSLMRCAAMSRSGATRCGRGRRCARRTRQIVAYVNGDRSEKACRELWDRIPKAYRACRTFSDSWKPYASVFSEGLHRSVGKESGETAHMERWDNTLRQRVGRMTRKTLSFSKDATWHDGVIHWFVVSYNSSLSVNV